MHFFSAVPNLNRALKNFSDERVEKVVMAYSRMLGNKSNDLSGAIAFLERKYKVNYDQRSSKEVSGMFGLSAMDHHIKSLAHAPSLVGLTFSIIDQLRDTSTMFSGGKLYVVNTSGSEIHIQGKGVREKLVQHLQTGWDTACLMWQAAKAVLKKEIAAWVWPYQALKC